MAMIDVPSQYLALAPLGGWPEAARVSTSRGTFSRLATRFMAWRAQRETLRLLSQVDRATLRDLGISDIEIGSLWRSERPHARLRPQLVEALARRRARACRDTTCRPKRHADKN